MHRRALKHTAVDVVTAVHIHPQATPDEAVQDDLGFLRGLGKAQGTGEQAP